MAAPRGAAASAAAAALCAALLLLAMAADTTVAERLLRSSSPSRPSARSGGGRSSAGGTGAAAAAAAAAAASPVRDDDDAQANRGKGGVVFDDDAADDDDANAFNPFFVAKMPNGTPINDDLRATTLRLREKPIDVDIADDDQVGSEADGFYPVTFPLGDIIEHWNPDDVDVPDDHDQWDTLRRLDYQNPAELAEAYVLRDAELPFVVYNIPALNEVVETWTDEYLLEQLAGQELDVERSPNNHFMYYAKQRYRDGQTAPEFVPPTDSIKMTLQDFWTHAQAADDNALGAEEPHLYMTIDGPNDKFNAGHAASEFSNPFMFLDYDFADMFDMHKVPGYSLFSKNAHLRLESEQAGKKWTAAGGVHCRFGERGAISESHFDHGRNIVAMPRGNKRYLMQPPSECEALQIMQTGDHARHSPIDFSRPEVAQQRYSKAAHEGEAQDAFYKAPSVDVVLHAGDALYIPAFWYHYPVNLDRTVQCNHRSGTSAFGAAHQMQCGVMAAPDEYDTATPVREAIARALASGTWPLADFPDVLDAMPEGPVVPMSKQQWEVEKRKMGNPNPRNPTVKVDVPGAPSAAQLAAATGGGGGSTAPAAPLATDEPASNNAKRPGGGGTRASGGGGGGGAGPGTNRPGAASSSSTSTSESVPTGARGLPTGASWQARGADGQKVKPKVAGDLNRNPFHGSSADRSRPMQAARDPYAPDAGPGVTGPPSAEPGTDMGGGEWYAVLGVCAVGIAVMAVRITRTVRRGTPRNQKPAVGL